jgi:hypothetical protein
LHPPHSDEESKDNPLVPQDSAWFRKTVEHDKGQGSFFPRGSGRLDLKTVFSLSTTGDVPQALFTFAGPAFPPINTDGEEPHGSLALAGMFYRASCSQAPN